MKRVNLTFLIVTLLFSFVSSISVDHIAENNLIIKEFPNNLTVEISMQDLVPGYYNVYTLSDLHILPFEPILVDFPKSIKKEFTFVPMDRLNLVNGTYVIRYFLNHRGFEKYENNLAIKVLSISDLVVVESDLVDLESEEITIFVKNLYDVELNNLTARFSSVLFDIEATFDLPERASAEIKVPISNEDLRKIKAGSYLINVEFDTPKGPVKSFGSVYLMEKEDVISQEDSGGLFIYSTTVNKINIGNTVEEVKVQIQKNIFSQYFTSFNREPLTKVREGTEIKYFWQKKITPSEVYTVKAKTNYFYPILILILIYLIYRYLRGTFMSRVFVRKKVTPIKTRGGEFALRVRVMVKAKSSVQNVMVVDKIPTTVKIYKKFGLSMPDEIDTVNRKLKWNAGDLRTGEERVYSYVVYSRVGFLGRFVLPPSKVHYSYNGRDKKEESTSAFFSSEQ